MRIAPVKSAATAAANYVNNGGSAAAATAWATNLSADLPAIFNAARAAGTYWQSQVNTAAALTAYQTGLSNAAANPQPIIAKIQGPSKNTYTSQIRASGAAGGKYNSFAAAWQPAVSTEVANLFRQYPTNDVSDATNRMIQYNTWARAQKGKFKQ